MCFLFLYVFLNRRYVFEKVGIGSEWALDRNALESLHRRLGKDLGDVGLKLTMQCPAESDFTTFFPIFNR